LIAENNKDPVYEEIKVTMPKQKESIYIGTYPNEAYGNIGLKNIELSNNVSYQTVTH